MSSGDVSEQATNEDDRNKYAVVLPCPPDQFRDFVSGLLGKPQTNSKRITGPFEIGKTDIENFHHLVVQRVGQQNEATLIQFTVTIVYDDNSTVLLNSLDDFVRYHEVRAITSEAAHLSWTFLVRFQDRQVVEKQQIDVSIVAGSSIPIISDQLVEHVFIGSQRKGFFFFRISHTARTWGADIEALLTGHIENLIKKVHPLKKFIRKNSGWIGLSVGLLLFLFSMAGSVYTTQAFLDSQLLRAEASKTPDAKLDYIVHVLATGSWPRFFFYVFCFLIVALVVSTVLGIWAASAADTEEPSFLLLSSQAEKHRAKQIAKTKKSWISFILSLLTSIGAGIVGRILFELFLRKWISP